MSGVADTSLMAFAFCQKYGITAGQQKRIVEALYVAGKPLTRAELEKRTGIRLSSICGAANTLVKLGKLVELPWRICTVTGFAAHPLTLPDRRPHLRILGKPTQLKLT